MNKLLVFLRSGSDPLAKFFSGKAPLGKGFAGWSMMMNRSFVHKWMLVVAVLCLEVVSLRAATYCVGPAATGSGTGADWNNLKAWSGTPVRGDIWYLVDGTYSGKTFSTAASGSTAIVIKKATVDAHGGIATGWNNSFGDGQATFTGTITISCSYFTFDGVTGSLSKDPTVYGFTFATTPYAFKVYNLNSVISDITISHASATSPSEAIERFFFSTDNSTKSIHRVTLSHCYGSGWENFQWATSANLLMDSWVTEYNMILNGWGSAAWHGEDINNNYGNHVNWTIRYNWFEGRQGAGATGIIVVLNGAAGPYWIYGNVFKDMRYGLSAMAGVHYNMSGGIYNNTFINVRNNYNNASLTGGDGGVSANFQNNLIVNGLADNATSGVRSHNSYYNCTGIPTQTGGQTLAADPFVNQAAGDYRLVLATAAGAALSSPYDEDLLGTLRGADGNWDRGAYEWTGNMNPAISVSPTGQDFGSVATNTTRDFSFTVRNSGGGTLGGSASVASPFSVVSGGAYSLGAGQSQTVTIRFTPTTAGSQSRVITFTGGAGTTATVSGTGTTPDNSPPSAGLTSPANGTITSNAVSIVAAASDNVGVVGVKFFIGSTAIFDDTAAPFSYSWDSTSVGNGSYQVYAQVRDAAGNTTWSPTNTITVANSPTALPTPLAYWDFSTNSGATVTDKQNNIPLTLRNSASLSAGGKSDSGLLLNGVADRADTPNTPVLNVAGSTLTVAAWVKLDSQGNWQQIVAKIKEAGAFTSPFFAWHLFGSHTSTTQWTPHFQLVNSSGTSVDAGSSVNVNYGEWAHVVGVYDGAAVRIYVNGVDRGSTAQSGSILSYDQPLYIGAHGLPGEFCKGVIDEVRVYGSALTANQVQTLFSTARPASPTNLRVASY